MSNPQDTNAASFTATATHALSTNCDVACNITASLSDTCFGHAMVSLPESEFKQIVEALRAANRLCAEALPKFNWGASALDANAITLLNETPAIVRDALALATRK